MCIRDRHMAVMIGAMTSERSLRSHVGIGSTEHCLAGDFLMMAVTSATVVAEIHLAYTDSMAFTEA